jgi:hypothetical protein
MRTITSSTKGLMCSGTGAAMSLPNAPYAKVARALGSIWMVKTYFLVSLSGPQPVLHLSAGDGVLILEEPGKLEPGKIWGPWVINDTAISRSFPNMLVALSFHQSIEPQLRSVASCNDVCCVTWQS